MKPINLIMVFALLSSIHVFATEIEACKSQKIETAKTLDLSGNVHISINDNSAKKVKSKSFSLTTIKNEFPKDIYEDFLKLHKNPISKIYVIDDFLFVVAKNSDCSLDVVILSEEGFTIAKLTELKKDRLAFKYKLSEDEKEERTLTIYK